MSISIAQGSTDMSGQVTLTLGSDYYDFRYGSWTDLPEHETLYTFSGNDTIYLPTSASFGDIDFFSYYSLDLGPGDDRLYISDHALATYAQDGNDRFYVLTPIRYGIDGPNPPPLYPTEKHILDGGDGYDTISLFGSQSKYDVAAILEDGIEVNLVYTFSYEYNFVGYLRNIEEIVFSGPVDDEINHHGNSMIAEASALAVEAYVEGGDGGEQSFLNWNHLSALELQVPAFTDTYTFVEGKFQTDVVAATVNIGVIDGQRTLAVTFAGTDSLSELFQSVFKAYDHYYSKFNFFTELIMDYIVVHSSELDRVVVSGHSLGGAMAQHFAHNLLPIVPNNKLSVFTFGSIGGSAATNDAAPVTTNFMHLDDVARDYYETNRAGSTILINNWRDNEKTGIKQHAKESYFRDTHALVELSFDDESPFYGTEIARVLREGSVWQGKTIQIAPGTLDNDKIQIHPLDDFVLGGGDNDKCSFHTSTSYKKSLVIDGGTGTDTISFVSILKTAKIDLGEGAGKIGKLIVDLYRIEDIKGTIKDDTLVGSDEDNRFIGGKGSDRLDGGLGSDDLKGNGGKDFFQLGPMKSGDLDAIRDFEQIDVIELQKKWFDDLGNRVSSKNFQIIGPESSPKGDEAAILYDITTGYLYYRDDGGAMSEFAILSNHPKNLTWKDFDIV